MGLAVSLLPLFRGRVYLDILLALPEHDNDMGNLDQNRDRQVAWRDGPSGEKMLMLVGYTYRLAAPFAFRLLILLSRGSGRSLILWAGVPGVFTFLLSWVLLIYGHLVCHILAGWDLKSSGCRGGKSFLSCLCPRRGMTAVAKVSSFTSFQSRLFFFFCDSYAEDL